MWTTHQLRLLAFIFPQMSKVRFVQPERTIRAGDSTTPPFVGSDHFFMHRLTCIGSSGCRVHITGSDLAVLGALSPEKRLS